MKSLRYDVKQMQLSKMYHKTLTYSTIYFKVFDHFNGADKLITLYLNAEFCRGSR